MDPIDLITVSLIFMIQCLLLAFCYQKYLLEWIYRGMEIQQVITLPKQLYACIL